MMWGLAMGFFKNGGEIWKLAPKNQQLKNDATFVYFGLNNDVNRRETSWNSQRIHTKNFDWRLVKIHEIYDIEVWFVISKRKINNILLIETNLSTLHWCVKNPHLELIVRSAIRLRALLTESEGLLLPQTIIGSNIDVNFEMNLDF